MKSQSLIPSGIDAVIYANDKATAYGFRSDFNHDGVLDSVDDQTFSESIGISYKQQ